MVVIQRVDKVFTVQIISRHTLSCFCSKQNDVPDKEPRHVTMSSLETSCRKTRRQTSKQHAPVPPGESSGAPSRPATVRSAGEEKKRTRGKAARAAAQHPEPTPSHTRTPHTPHTPATHGHLPQKTSTGSQKSPPRGRRKKTEKAERSDFIPEGKSDDRTDPDPTRTKQQQAKITQTHTQGQKRAAKHTHDTLVSPSLQQDTPVTSSKSDSGTRAPGRGRGRHPNPRLGSTPPTEPQISPETVAVHFLLLQLDYSNAKFLSLYYVEFFL